jgi:hypothetical protein
LNPDPAIDVFGDLSEESLDITKVSLVRNQDSALLHGTPGKDSELHRIVAGHHSGVMGEVVPELPEDRERRRSFLLFLLRRPFSLVLRRQEELILKILVGRCEESSESVIDHVVAEPRVGLAERLPDRARFGVRDHLVPLRGERIIAVVGHEA